MSEASTNQSLPREWIDRIFVRLHGRFGNQFFEKYRLGQIGKTGEDAGIENAKSVWSDELSGYSVDEIKRGLSASYKYPPSCDDFRMACRPFEDSIKDGRYTADEAWAKLPKDDNYGALVTSEMEEAAGFAWPLLEIGDKVAARMAFKDAYERIVSNARAVGHKPRWRVSMGFQGGNVEAATEGLKTGLLSLEYIRTILSPDDADFVATSAGYQLSLPAPTARGKQYALEAKKLIADMISKMD